MRWAKDSEIKPGAPLRRGRHYLYLVAVGTTWRLLWAPSIAFARAGAADLLFKQSGRSAEYRVRRARASDLLLLADVSAWP